MMFALHRVRCKDMAVVLGRQMDNSLFETIEAADEADQKLLSEG